MIGECDYMGLLVQCDNCKRLTPIAYHINIQLPINRHNTVYGGTGWSSKKSANYEFCTKCYNKLIKLELNESFR